MSAARPVLLATLLSLGTLLGLAQTPPTPQIITPWANGGALSAPADQGILVTAQVTATFANSSPVDRDYVITVRITSVPQNPLDTVVSYRDYPVTVGGDGGIATARVSTSLQIGGAVATGTVYIDATIRLADGTGSSSSAAKSATWYLLPPEQNDDPPQQEI